MTGVLVGLVRSACFRPCLGAFRLQTNGAFEGFSFCLPLQSRLSQTLLAIYLRRIYCECFSLWQEIGLVTLSSVFSQMQI